jgi:transcriptional regulator with XRE-family HTH domain
VAGEQLFAKMVGSVRALPTFSLLFKSVPASKDNVNCYDMFAVNDKYNFTYSQFLLDNQEWRGIILESVENADPSVENLAERVNSLFGQRLALARRSRRVSQAELANRVGRSRVTIANLESGKQNVQLHQVFTLAAALDVPATELIPDSVMVKQDPQTAITEAFIQATKLTLQSRIGGIK